MPCCGNRRKAIEFRPEQKWDYITLTDFRSKGCGAPTAYGYLWFSLVLSVALYAVDTFTAVNLLVFDRWSSDIKPAISINISKYIFAACIIASVLNLVFEWVRAFRVMKRGNIAECYLDNLAVRWESIRMGSGHGWRRFLVFAELTKSKKGAEYIALFTYFSFQSWIRVLVCTGPRQVVNAFTLKAVYESDLLTAEADVGSSLSTFFGKLQMLAEKDYRQAVILSGMAFTLVIWVFSVLFLLAAVLFYVLFLFHWIPRADGGLTGYCERKINKALLKIVTKKVNSALERGEADRYEAEAKAAEINGFKPTLQRAATLPTIPDLAFSNDKPLKMPTLTRAPALTSLPEYASQPASSGGFELGALDQKRTIDRTKSPSAAAASYSSRASLILNAADIGYSAPSEYSSPSEYSDSLGVAMHRAGPPSYRSGTSSSMRSMVARNNMAKQQQQQQPQRPPFVAVYAREYTDSPMTMDNEVNPFGPPARSPTTRSVGSYLSSPSAAATSAFSPPAAAARSLLPDVGRNIASHVSTSSPPRPPYYDGNINNGVPLPRSHFPPNGGLANPSPSSYTNTSNIRGPPRLQGPPVNHPRQIRSATNPVPRPSPALHEPRPLRNFTSSIPQQLAAEADGYGYYDGGIHSHESRPDPSAGPSRPRWQTVPDTASSSGPP